MINTVIHDNGIATVRPGVERLTAVNAHTFKSEVGALIDTNIGHIVIDFEQVSFLDSSGLGALVGIMKKIGHRGEISVCGLNEDLQHMFKLSRMDRVFAAHSDAQTAVTAMSESL